MKDYCNFFCIERIRNLRTIVLSARDPTLKPINKIYRCINSIYSIYKKYKVLLIHGGK